MNFITVYLLLVLPLPLTLATGAVSFVSQFDVAYYERNCQHYFSTDCPVHGHESWLCSKIITNCTSPDYPYHCILNTAGKVVHVCAAAQICPKGTVPIFDPRTHMVSCKDCSKGYYQPVDTWSNNTPVCMQKFGCDINYHKIECTVDTDMEQTQDTLCRCDARNGYILSSSEWGEICFPGKFADCIEFECPDGQERLLNYTCAPKCEEGFQRNDSDICIPKSTVITTTEGDKATQTSTASTENVSKGSISENNVLIVAVVISAIVTIIFIVVIVVCWKRMVCCRQFIQVPADDITDNENVNKNNVPTDDNAMEFMPMNNAPNDDPELGTMNIAPNDNVELGTMRNGTNANSQPRDIPNRETPSPDTVHRTVLNRCMPVLIRDLDVMAVKIYLQQKEIFDDVTIRDIMEQATTTEKITMLIDKLKQKPKNKYEEFKDCLVQARREDLKKMLEEFEENITKEIGETHQAQDTALDMDISSPGNSLDAV